MRNRIERDLAIQRRRRIAAPFRNQRVRGFMAGGREQKNNVVNEAKRREIRATAQTCGYGRGSRSGLQVVANKEVLIESCRDLPTRDRTRIFLPASAVSHRPVCKSPRANGPIETRTSRSTSIPSDSNMRRMCRFFPSSSTISIHEFFSPERSRAARLAFRISPRFFDAASQSVEQTVDQRWSRSVHDKSCRGGIPAR